ASPPIVIERLAVLLDQIEELPDSPRVTPACACQSDITFPNSSGVILSITASTSGDATASRIVNVASTSSSLRPWRNRPIGQFPNFGSVYVFPFHSKVNTSSSVGVLRPCVYLTVMISPDAAPKLHGRC